MNLIYLLVKEKSSETIHIVLFFIWNLKKWKTYNYKDKADNEEDFYIQKDTWFDQ